MIAIMTVTGLDHTGIIAAVSAKCAELDVNILNVSQTIMDKYFTMILHVQFDDDVHGISDIQDAMKAVEDQEKLVIRVQSEAIFSAMHQI
ncbi:ACT domain-containing protein [Corynebacterium sp. 320]|uniref:UPF0237 protein F8377_05095 n=1 Tax=Corynebacterium zhongnanshanii TaxID=2768834 RepID=A0ABQ6VGE0_9CORY|nr:MULTISPECIES: ACT domain-containing protein [Corynebacterium]KAB1503657.1 ACT domain-containing protein [Corynebacterium sp. 320]KAB1553242.1 ACT domain-containing protein [Corynebacterium sp. 321]KAB1553539.1 ACT domain-containing protein [Corynebacterium sp. 319]KAB3523492.1 ACT domain-containing protein [Corynebacterium zhongnanshanii]KAB3527793.1 ACT domain-containing protein [Corynebacterium sp. 250]